MRSVVRYFSLEAIKNIYCITIPNCQFLPAESTSRFLLSIAILKGKLVIVDAGAWLVEVGGNNDQQRLPDSKLIAIEGAW